MSAQANHFKIGMFVLAGLMILLAGLFAFGARSYFEEKTTFETYVTGDVEGLSVGSSVMLRGVPVGKVSRIDFTFNQYPECKENYVLVEFEVEKKILPVRLGPIEEILPQQIQRGLRARVKSQGITGLSFVSIETVDPDQNPAFVPPFTPRHYYIPSAQSQFSQMLDSIEQSLRHLEDIEFAQIGRSLTNVLASMDRLVNNADRLDFHKLEGEASRLIAEVGQTNRKLEGFVDQAGGTLKGMQLEAVSQKASRMLADLAETNRKLQDFLDHYMALDLAPLNDALVNTRQATENLNDLLRNLKEYPSAALFGEPPPPAKSVAPRKR